MKLTVLTDNTVLQGKNFLGEHGLSLYIEADDKKILFDTGYSDVFIKNAQKMGINILDIDYIVLSHGHYDHTWGLTHYIPLYSSSIKQGKHVQTPTILTHPDTFNSKYEDKTGEIGSIVSIDKIEKYFKLNLTPKPYWISENLIFLGEIPRLNDFEGKESIGKVFKNNTYENDYILEDSALAYKTDKGLVIITGCSHSGICNIIEYAKKICNETRIYDIIGGFHLVKANETRLTKTSEFLSKLKLKQLHPCHCTDFHSITFLSKHLPLQETGAGKVLTYKDNDV